MRFKAFLRGDFFRYMRMITVQVRKQGGAAIMTIPANVLKILALEIGSEVALDVSKNRLIVKPVKHYQRKRYGLKELLKGASAKNIKALNDATKWAREGKSIGREIT